MFQKGQSGNPGGKPRTQKKFQELLALEIQAKTGGSAGRYFCRKLYDFIEFGDTHKVKFAALELAMAYFMGRPQQMVEVNNPVDIVAILNEARGRVGMPPLTAEETPLVVPDTDDEITPV